MKVRHLFITPNGDMLDRWSEAFPDAVAIAHEEIPGRWKPENIWLRLASESEHAGSISKEVRRLFPHSALIVLSDQPSDDEGLRVFAEGARGYANAHSAPDALRHISDVVAQGGLWIGQSLMQRLLTATSNLARAANAPRQDWSSILSVRELEVARAVANGASNKEIARELDITERTVKAHVSAILEKLEVRDRLQISLKINGLS